MDVSDPASIALSPGMAGVLRVLSGADAAFTVRNIARLAGVSHTRAGQVIDRFAEHGLVRTDQQGPSRMCRLNWDHLAARPLVELVRLHDRMLDLIRSVIEGWPYRPEHVSLFGSAARGDGGVRSDLDVLVIRSGQSSGDEEAWRVQLFEGGERIHAATGNEVAWFEVTRDDLRRAVQNHEPVIDEWRRDAVHLIGVDLHEILRSLT